MVGLWVNPAALAGYLSQDGEAIKAEGGVWRRKMHRGRPVAVQGRPKQRQRCARL